MATTGRKQVGPGQVIQSAEWGNVVWDQSVQCFASAADRTNQYPTPHTGAVSWLDDTRGLYVWDGALWRAVPQARSRLLQSGTSTVSTNGAGGWTLTFPIAYPAGVVPVVTVCDGDASGTNINLLGLIQAQCTNTTAGGVARTSQTGIPPAVNTTIRINFTAAG